MITEKEDTKWLQKKRTQNDYRKKGPSVLLHKNIYMSYRDTQKKSKKIVSLGAVDILYL